MRGYPTGVGSRSGKVSCSLRIVLNLVIATSISSRVFSFHSPETWLCISALYLPISTRVMEFGCRFFSHNGSAEGGYDRGMI